MGFLDFFSLGLSGAHALLSLGSSGVLVSNSLLSFASSPSKSVRQGVWLVDTSEIIPYIDGYSGTCRQDKTCL